MVVATMLKRCPDGSAFACPRVRRVGARLVRRRARVPRAAGGRARRPPRPAPWTARSRHAVEKALGGEVTELPSGLYEVDPARGPDSPPTARTPASDDPGRTTARASAPATPSARRSVRPTTTSTSSTPTAPRTRTASPRSGPTIQASIRRMNAVLNEESLATAASPPTTRCSATRGGEIQVDSFATPQRRRASSDVVTAARPPASTTPDVDYTIFFDYDHPQRLRRRLLLRRRERSRPQREQPRRRLRRSPTTAAGSARRRCTRTATTRGRSSTARRTRPATALTATTRTTSCATRPTAATSNQGGSLNRCTDRLYFDCGYDTYFDSAPEPASTSPPTGTWARRSTASSSSAARRGRRRPSGGSGRPPEPPADRPRRSSPAPTPASTPRRSARQPRPLADSAASAGRGAATRFRVPRGSSRLVVTLDCAAHVRRPARPLRCAAAADPTPTDYDCRSAGPAPDEACRVRAPAPRHLAHRRLRRRTGTGGVGVRDRRRASAASASASPPSTSRIAAARPRAPRRRRCRAALDHRDLHQLRLLPGREGVLADQPAQPDQAAADERQRDVQQRARPARATPRPCAPCRRSSAISGPASSIALCESASRPRPSRPPRARRRGPRSAGRAPSPSPEIGSIGSSARRRSSVTQGSSRS